MSADPDVIAQIRRTLNVLFEAGDVTELRILHAGKYGVISGFYDDFDRLAHDAAGWDGHVPAVYIVLNPVWIDLLDRSPNKLKTHCKTGNLTRDRDVVMRRWLPLDFDPIRPADTSSSDQEHSAAIARARTVRSSLALDGWPEAILADSGNGAWLFYRLDLENDDGARERVRSALVTIAERFSTKEVKIDRSVSNAARIVRLFGTWNRKGQNIPDRPHRQSKILEIPE